MENFKQTILVTGGSGLVGTAIQAIMTENSYNAKYNFVFVSSNHCNLTNYFQTLDFFTKVKPDYVIHLAANVGGLYKNMAKPVDMLETNILINSNVLKASHELRVKKLIGCLSTCIFPDKISYSIDEKSLHSGPPHNSNFAYAYAKRLLEVQARAYREQYGDNFVCIIPTNIYGPNDNFNLEDAHVIPALIHKCYLAKKSSEPFVVFGTGKPLRQFIHSEDLARLIMWTLENYLEPEPIILSGGEEDETSIGDIAKIIAKKFDYESSMIFDSSKSDGQYKKTASNLKLLELIGDYKFISIESGISDTIDWFCDNYDICRK